MADEHLTEGTQEQIRALWAGSCRRAFALAVPSGGNAFPARSSVTFWKLCDIRVICVTWAASWDQLAL